MSSERFRTPVTDLEAGSRVPVEEMVTEQGEPVVPHDLPSLPLPFGDGAVPDGDGD